MNDPKGHDPRLIQISADTEALIAAQREILRLRASRARATWSLVTDTKETIASIARAIDEPEIRFRKSVETYRDGIPKFKRGVS